MKKKILIVEDDLDLNYIMERVLQLLSYNSIVVTSGKQAIAVAAAERPDLVILDMILPEMDGLNVASLIRENPQTHSIPILATTAMLSREECLQNGCDDYIGKPYTAKELLSRIEKLLT